VDFPLDSVDDKKIAFDIATINNQTKQFVNNGFMHIQKEKRDYAETVSIFFIHRAIEKPAKNSRHGCRAGDRPNACRSGGGAKGYG
jgi:hypothetical protein